MTMSPSANRIHYLDHLYKDLNPDSPSLAPPENNPPQDDIDGQQQQRQHPDNTQSTTIATPLTTTAITDSLCIKPFYFPFGKPISTVQRDLNDKKIFAVVRHLYGIRTFLREEQFVPVTKACGLPRYLNMALFRRMNVQEEPEDGVSFEQFVRGWIMLSYDRYSDESIIFNILKRPGFTWLNPEDFIPVLEDIVYNHPGLQSLADNPMFQERYIETVICRLYYDGRCPGGKMNLNQFRQSKFTMMIKALGPNIDLNNTHDCFSYKHFYVIYCKFWALDTDHNLIISQHDLMKYNQSTLSIWIVHRIMTCGRIAAFDQAYKSNVEVTPVLTYLDYIWFLLSEIDKSTTMAIEYWFRCMDVDGNGVLTKYELAQFWEDQDARQRYYGVGPEDRIQFKDVMCQMNDLIQPKTPNQFRLSDLKRNGYMAERFFDTFLNFDRFQIHESPIAPPNEIEKEDEEDEDEEEEEEERFVLGLPVSESTSDLESDISLPNTPTLTDKDIGAIDWSIFAKQAGPNTNYLTWLNTNTKGNDEKERDVESPWI
ncbi:hypothetical protein PHYBLDRAFT_70884 [Phycomyces blakesleeanus NRRL 1555(-)]|uniref:EF-hand domain-containing protein n=1 Tax=Phycomyces blakesleeanus (strain ATCC 8743b / DSM 1359 / FGSC 10004 / NBRC 33097 / NRRL 1555) TaxID=763407 RepID=A0A167JPC8_PHYB8|nr:hypothetical protein PHYBLDRAFT_70884 [Phycomyces blakesleeanus NRRL 1555(-)]OAD66429.1 hypothetical protein PHYBLDRAFT_70884 [Phycomyces blakesleeanus NRRL 1555(-)]|eukprot:XP_018284469.1 hypothetical protein PHYBLDRAFT_70884 [Phycomyces blakesleeanus NRRL 1555(-)]